MKSDLLKFCAASLAIAGVLSACSEGVAAPKTVGEKEAKKPIVLAVGDILAVRLASNATTGYEWEVAGTDAKILPIEGKTEFIAPDTDRAGAPGEQIWRFKALAPGKIKLELHYRRPWEKVAPAQTWSAPVEVR